MSAKGGGDRQAVWRCASRAYSRVTSLLERLRRWRICGGHTALPIPASRNDNLSDPRM